jgi:surface antigen
MSPSIIWRIVAMRKLMRPEGCMMRIYCTIVALLSAIAGAAAAPCFLPTEAYEICSDLPAVTASLPVAPPREPADEVLIADLLGNELDRMLDPVDRQQLRELLQWVLETDPTFRTEQTFTTEQTFETVGSGYGAGRTNGHIAGTIVASPAFKNAAGQWCRKLAHSITVGRQTRSGNSTACRSDEGQWDLIQ